jgi:hypothetical protein
MIGFEPQVEENKRKKKKKVRTFFFCMFTQEGEGEGRRGIRTNDPYFIRRDSNRLNYFLGTKCKLKYY